MSGQRLVRLCSPLVACAFVLQAYGCQDPGEAENDSIRSAHLTFVNYVAPAALPIPKAQPAESAKEQEAPGEAPQGACSQKDREDYVHDASLKFTNQLRTCSRETWANNSKNLACLTENLPSLSKGCAQCFADMASCAKDNCMMACMMDSKGLRCISCVNANCQASLVKCTGVARADLP